MLSHFHIAKSCIMAAGIANTDCYTNRHSRHHVPERRLKPSSLHLHHPLSLEAATASAFGFIYLATYSIYLYMGNVSDRRKVLSMDSWGKGRRDARRIERPQCAAELRESAGMF